MNIKELSNTEIKALLYDSAQELNRIDHNMKMLTEELRARARAEAPSPPEDAKQEEEKGG